MRVEMEEKDAELGGRVVVPLLQDVDIHSPLDPSYRGASLSSAVFNISTTMIGAGIMSIPATFKVLGIIPALLVILVVALMGYATGNFLLSFTHSGKSTTYAGLMAESFGLVGSLAMQISVMITSFGCLIIYLIIIGDVLTGTKSGERIHTGILQEWFGFYWWTSRAVALLLVVLLVLLPLALFGRIVMAIQALIQGKTQSLRLLPDFSDQGTFLSLFTTIPVFMTAFGYHINIHSIRAELGEPSDMKLAVRISLIICAAFYFCIGFFGYLLFGDSTNGDFLVNFDQYSSGRMVGAAINAIVRLSYAVHLMLVFPLMNYTLRANVDELFFPEKPQLTKDTTRFVCLTCILLTLAYIVAIAILSIWYCFQILGSTTVLCLILIFPASICLRDVHGISTAWDRVVAVMLIAAALATSVITIWTNLASPSGSGNDLWFLLSFMPTLLQLYTFSIFYALHTFGWSILSLIRWSPVLFLVDRAPRGGNDPSPILAGLRLGSACGTFINSTRFASLPSLKNQARGSARLGSACLGSQALASLNELIY